jgi:hypothetical protein
MERNMTSGESMIEDGHAYTKEHAEEDLARVYQVYRDTLRGLVDSCCRNFLLLNKEELALAMENVGEALYNEAEHALSILPRATYIPHDHKELINAEHDRLIEWLRLKPVDFSDVIYKAMKP